MKNIKNYVLSTMAMLFFISGFMGIKAEASLQQVTGMKQTGADPTTVELEWNAVPDGVDYQVDISEDGQNWGELDKDSTGGQANIKLSGLSSGSTYYIRILAFKEEVNEDTGETIRIESDAYSEVFECVTTPSGEPEYLHKTNSTITSISLEWGTVAGANAYIVTYAPDEKGATELSITVDINKAILTNLRENTDYNIHVQGARKNATESYIAKDGVGELGKYGVGVTPLKVTGLDIERYLVAKCDVIPCANGYEAEAWTAYQKKDKRIVKAECEYSTKVSGITTTYLDKPALEKSNFFKVRMRAYSVTSKGTKKYGEWSDWRYVCKQPKITDINVSKKGMKLTWNAIKGADRYTIYASLKKKSGYKKITTTKKTSYTMAKFNKKKLQKAKTYYFYVVAEKKEGKNYYSGEVNGDCEKRWSKKYKY